MTEADALRQIIALAEFGTTGPDTTPPCKSGPLSAKAAAGLRGAISHIARDALLRSEMHATSKDHDTEWPKEES